MIETPTLWIPLNQNAGSITTDNANIERIQQDGTTRIEQNGTIRTLNDNALIPTPPTAWTEEPV